jgi:hypothetical protein
MNFSILGKEIGSKSRDHITKRCTRYKKKLQRKFELSEDEQTILTILTSKMPEDSVKELKEISAKKDFQQPMPAITGARVM